MFQVQCVAVAHDRYFRSRENRVMPGFFQLPEEFHAPGELRMQGRFAVPGIGYVPDISAPPARFLDPFRDFPGDFFGLKSSHPPETRFVHAAGQAVAFAYAVNQAVVDGYGPCRFHSYLLYVIGRRLRRFTGFQNIFLLYRNYPRISAEICVPIKLEDSIPFIFDSRTHNPISDSGMPITQD